MALSERKIRLWALLSVAFIPLSVLSNPMQDLEGHRCYWCGPLAEQVHRSQRAVKCNGDKSIVTICDEDLPYCAIVASSPPYVESRFCVKFYQDECYPLYCKSTKIWKVVCPCRGELCNGPNTKRENEVFEALLELTQTKRLKRALVTNGAFMGITTRRNTTDNVTIEQNVEVPTDDVKNKEVDNVANSIIESHNSQNPSTDEISEIEDTATTSEVPKTVDTVKETPKVEVPTTENLNTVKLEEPIESNQKIESNDQTLNENFASATLGATAIEQEAEVFTSVNSNVATDSNTVDTTSIENYIGNDTKLNEDPAPKEPNQINNIHTLNETNTNIGQNQQSVKIDIPITNIDSDDLKTDIIVMNSNKTNQENDSKLKSDIETMVEIIPSAQTNAPETKSTAMELHIASTETITENAVTTLEIKVEKAKSKANEVLPAAEALQHNDTPSTKTTDPIHTTITTLMDIKTNINHTTQPTMPTMPNNTAVRLDTHILKIVIGVILLY